MTTNLNEKGYGASFTGKAEELLRLRTGITSIHTLGPAGTNCERAAQKWFTNEGRRGEIHLHSTLETAAQLMRGERGAALLGCVVYPDLHTLVFSNLDWLVLVDCFVMPTHNMILATREGTEVITSVASHPAPVRLIPPSIRERQLVNSNVQAAIDCSRGLSDGCITTIVAAEEYGLKIIQDFGPVLMGFTIHAQLEV